MARKPKLRAVKVNCKQCKIFKVTVNEVEADFEYYDMTQGITDLDCATNQYSVDQFAVSHKYAVLESDPDTGAGNSVNN